METKSVVRSEGSKEFCFKTIQPMRNYHVHMNALTKILINTYLSDSNTKHRWFLWKKCLYNLKQWNLSSGSASFSLRRNSNSFRPVLCLKIKKKLRYILKFSAILHTINVSPQNMFLSLIIDLNIHNTHLFPNHLRTQILYNKRNIISMYISNNVHMNFILQYRNKCEIPSILCFVDRCLSFCTFSFGHCVVCSSI